MKLLSHLTLCWLLLGLVTAPATPSVQGSLTDAATGETLPGRLTIQHKETGEWYLATSAAEEGRAIPYEVRRIIASTEVHTSLSAHPFRAELPPGTYTLIAERGKEYLPAEVEVMIPAKAAETIHVTLPLQRWSNLSAQGWYSGDTHTHRPLAELPTLMLAEDLNVTLPLTAWVTDSRQTPSQANKNPEPVPPAKLITIDPTHVIWPVNTEYEIFTVNGKPHTLGAVFVLNHREALDLPAPPVTPIAAEARRQGALLDLDKHNWPWSMMLMPTMKVDLFELTNNHLWQTRFLFRDWYPEYAQGLPVAMTDDGLFTERGWIDFGFHNYYALLNCGFDMKPSAGTASGVHPVPLGFGRVYVRVEGAFSYDRWIDGLKSGNSFVTTGPMLITEQRRSGDLVTVTGEYSSPHPLDRLEIIANGEVVAEFGPSAPKSASPAHRFTFTSTVSLGDTSWVAVRAFENRPDGRPRFAHTAPVHHQVDGTELRPRPFELDYLKQRIEDEIKRHRSVLTEEALAEYRQALAYFNTLRPRLE